jgi:dipeptide/tripeptide permease
MSSLPAKASARSIIAAMVMLVGVVVLALGYFLNAITLLYVGVFVILIGVLSYLVSDLFGQRLRSLSTRRTL